MRDWDRWQRRQRRQALIRAALAWAGLFALALIVVTLGWLAIVGFMVVFG